MALESRALATEPLRRANPLETARRVRLEQTLAAEFGRNGGGRMEVEHAASSVQGRAVAPLVNEVDAEKFAVLVVVSYCAGIVALGYHMTIARRHGLAHLVEELQVARERSLGRDPHPFHVTPITLDAHELQNEFDRLLGRSYGEREGGATSNHAHIVRSVHDVSFGNEPDVSSMLTLDGEFSIMPEWRLRTSFLVNIPSQKNQQTDLKK